ncbi:MAG: class I SAM-dependent methyltransferase [Candidatus Altiarchaeota archaeon]|nr:class I SAM-dependent methyltransferase [Candidatus Altiarchaeota archaeon]
MNLNKKTVETYNSKSGEYDKVWGNDEPQFWQDKIEAFLHNLPSNERVLDSGCGPGRDLKTFTKKGIREVYGIDLAESMVKIAKERAPEANIQKMSVTNLKYSNNFFDGIFSVGVFHHLDKPDFEKAVKEAYRVLKRNGILSLDVQTRSKEFIQEKNTYGGSRYFFQYSPQYVENTLKSNGFEIIKSKIQDSKDQDVNWLLVLARTTYI